jgi:hypothetical protein
MPAENKPDLIYTIAFDPPGCGGTRQTAKMLASSLLRTGFAGHIIVFRSTDEPLFRVERLGLEEQHITLPSMAPEDLARYVIPSFRPYLFSRFGLTYGCSQDDRWPAQATLIQMSRLS